MVEIDLERGAREIGGGELERRLREIDTVMVPRSAVFIMLASPQAMSRKANGDANAWLSVSCRMAPTSRWERSLLVMSLR